MQQSKVSKLYGLLIFTAFVALPAQAVDVKISNSLSYVETPHEGRLVKIKRIQDTSNVLTGGYTKTSRKCPPFCVQPMAVAPGVTTVGELELLDFIENNVNVGNGVLIDARTESWFKKGTIPGSINIPFKMFDEDSDDLEKEAALTKLGVTPKGDSSIGSIIDSVKGLFGDESVSSQWDFSKAKKVMLWCNGMWCGQSPRAIRGMLAMGYPAEKISYYRGGMQAWKSLGLTTK